MLPAILIMSLGLINLRFDLLGQDNRAWWNGQIRRLLIGLPLCALWVYFALPPLVNWVGYSVMLLGLGVNALLTLVPQAARARPGERWKCVRVPTLALIISLLIPLYLHVLVVPFRSTALRDVPTVVELDDPMPVMNPEHIRLVPIETALWKAQKAVGDLGTGFAVGELSIQMIDDKLYWVAPLEFRGPLKWLSYQETPGFVLVDGEDPDAAAVLHESRLIYTPSACLYRDLKRHVYQLRNDALLLEVNFELDDDFSPWYIVSIGVPTVGATGARTTGVILVHPETGELREYTLEDMPEWIDEAIPETIAERHNYWFGRYAHGFWNSLFGQKGVHTPTVWGDEGIDVFGVIGADNRFYWFTGHTSPSTQDGSLMGYTMTDGRTGIIYYYRNAVGYYNESAAVSSVNAAVANYAGWHGAQPLLYNLYGAESYVVPILSANNNLQAVGIVNAKTGQTVVKPTKAEALLVYRQYLGSGLGDTDPTQTATAAQLEGTVARVGQAVVQGNTIFYFHLANSDRIFTAHASLSSEVALTQPGDQVRLGYLDTNETTVPLITFDNLALPGE
jgi:hypothetical protein